MCSEDEKGIGSTELVQKLLEIYGETVVKLSAEDIKKQASFFVPLTEGEIISKLISCIRGGTSMAASAIEILETYSKLGGLLAQLVATNITSLGEAVLHAESNLPQDKLTITRWGFAHILSILLGNPDKTTQILSSLSIDVWRALSSWFLQYPQSSLCMYLCCDWSDLHPI